jgi:hypothetical protein
MPTPYSPGAGRENPNLDQNARAVAGLRVASTGAAMGQIDQNLHALEHDVVRFAALNARHKSDAASVVLVLGPVESLSLRQASKWVKFLHVIGLVISVVEFAEASFTRETGGKYTSTPIPDRLSGKYLSYHRCGPIVPGQ